MRKLLPVVLLVAAVGVVVVVRAQCRHKDGEVAIPPATAGPVEIVTAYVAALDQHDIATAKALSTPEHAAQAERATDSWYRNVRSITGLRVGEQRPEEQGVFVPVTFDLDQCDEESIQDGEMVWGYELVRTADRWLVTDEGPV